MQADLQARVLPQQHVVLEVHGHLAVERHVQHRDELALEPVAHAGRGALLDLRGKDLVGRTAWSSLANRSSRGSRPPLPARSGREYPTPARRHGIIAAWRTIYVTGHRNPDTDSIASAIGYAELRRRLDPNNDYVPVRLGDTNPQTNWLLERSGAPEPRFLAHVLVRACDVMHSDFPVDRTG